MDIVIQVLNGIVAIGGYLKFKTQYFRFRLL